VRVLDVVVAVHNTSGSTVSQERSSGNRDELQIVSRDARSLLRAICSFIEHSWRCKRAFQSDDAPTSSLQTSVQSDDAQKPFGSREISTVKKMDAAP
jgi:hypothetical protein